MDGARTDMLSPTSDERRRRSWIDATIDTIHRLPGPAWLPYMVAGLVLIGLEAGVSLSSSGTVTGFTVYFALAGVYAVGYVDWTRTAAGRALDRSRTSRADVPDAQERALRERLTRMPAVPTALSTIAGVAVGLLLLIAAGPIDEQLRAVALAPGPGATVIHLPLYVFNYGATGAAVHRVILQAQAIAATYAVSRVDLFRPGPLHAFAVLSATSVVGLAVMLYAPVLIPSEAGPVLWAVRSGIGVLLAAVFLWPLWGVHRLLQSERTELLDRNLDQWRRFFDTFHERLASGRDELPDIERNVIDTIEREGRALRAASTWPWPAEVIPTVFGAIIIPLVLSLLLTVGQQLLAD